MICCVGGENTNKMHYDNNENNDRKQERRQKIHKHKKKSPSFYDEEDLSHNRIKKEYKKIKETFDDEEWEDWDKYYNH